MKFVVALLAWASLKSEIVTVTAYGVKHPSHGFRFSRTAFTSKMSRSPEQRQTACTWPSAIVTATTYSYRAAHGVQKVISCPSRSTHMDSVSTIHRATESNMNTLQIKPERVPRNVMVSRVT